MQTSAPPGAIQLSEAAASALRASAPPDLFTLTLRGKFDVKGKGIMETYILSPPPPRESGVAVPAPLGRAASMQVRAPPRKRPSAVTRDRLGALTSENLMHHVELLGNMGLKDVVEEAGGSRVGVRRVSVQSAAQSSGEPSASCSLSQRPLSSSLPPPPAAVSLTSSVATSAVAASPSTLPISNAALLPRAVSVTGLPRGARLAASMAGPLGTSGTGAVTAGRLFSVESGRITRSSVLAEDVILAAKMNSIDFQPLIKHASDVVPLPLLERPCGRGLPGLGGNHRFVFSLRFVCPGLEAQYQKQRCAILLFVGVHVHIPKRLPQPENWFLFPGLQYGLIPFLS